jgi:hypothetical protein
MGAYAQITWGHSPRQNGGMRPDRMGVGVRVAQHVITPQHVIANGVKQSRSNCECAGLLRSTRNCKSQIIRYMFSAFFIGVKLLIAL